MAALRTFFIAPLGAGRNIPPVDVACNADSDCIVTSDELVDAPGWKAAFDAACKAAPPRMCPPLGCAMAPAQPARRGVAK